MKIDEIYELIAVNILSNIKVDNWEKAVLNIQGDDNAMGINGFYIVNGKKECIDVNNFDDNIEFALMELHEITTEDGSNPWNCAEYTLIPDGSFYIDFRQESELE